MKRLAGLLLLLASCAVPRSTTTLEPDRYFARAGLPGSVLHVRGTGSFSIYVMDCFGGHDERTRGTWKRVSPDTLAFFHEQWFRGVSCGTVRVSVGGHEWPERVPHIKADIEKWLREHPSEASFQKWDLRLLGHYSGEFESNGEKVGWSCFPVFFASDPVPRSDLEGVVRALASYADVRDKNTNPVRLMRAKGRTFLHPAELGSGLEDRESLQESVEEVEGLEKDELSLYVFVQVSKEFFDEAMKGPADSDE